MISFIVVVVVVPMKDIVVVDVVVVVVFVPFPRTYGVRVAVFVLRAGDDSGGGRLCGGRHWRDCCRSRASAPPPSPPATPAPPPLPSSS